MSCIATFDIGTTAVKAVLVGEKGEVIARLSREIPTRYEGGEVTQRPEDWWEAFRALSAEMLPGAPEVLGIVMSGQMQDVIPVGGDLSPVCPAILYSDGRAEAEAEEIRTEMKARAAKPADGDPCLRITGNHCDGTLSLPKVLWLKRHAPEMYEKTRCFLISSKDYVIARLTGETVGDYTACSTAGGMDLEKKVWSGEILAAAGVAPEKMPRLLPSHGLAGRVTPEAAAGTGYPEGTPVYAGVGDAGATTLASGIVRPGQYNINLGTSGWVATVSEGPLFNEGGIFNLAAMPEGGVINVVPFLNAGNVHQWVSRLFSADGEPDYAHTQALLDRSVPGARGVFALPYLAGERFPVADPQARGAFVGLSPETRPEDLTRAMLEGVAFSIRQGMEMLGEKPRSVSIIGGGGRVDAWCQMLADVLGQRVTVCPDADTLPARAIASAVLLARGNIESYDAFIERLLAETSPRCYQPDPETVRLYEGLYRRYIRLYPALRNWAREVEPEA